MADFNNDVTGGQGQTNHGTTQVPGIIGTARQGDGTQYITQDGGLDFNGTKSINLWLKTTDDTRYAAVFGSAWDGNDGELMFSLNTDGGVNVGWLAIHGALGSAYFQFDCTILRNGNWNMVTITKPDNIANNIKLYINSVEISNYMWGTGRYDDITLQPTTPFTILARSGDSPLNGAVDEWATWNAVLTQDQITMLYNGGAGLPYSGYGTAPPVEFVELIVGTGANGTTTPIGGIYTFPEGTTTTIGAVANLGYALDYWVLDGNPAGSSNPLSVTMNTNHTVTPVFISTAPTPDTGGIITYDGIYTIHTFLSNGTYVCNTAKDIEILLIGGGGGGGATVVGGYSRGGSGGGGAGGYIHNNSYALTTGNHFVVVGDGGLSNSNGEDSQIDLLVAEGGGAGGGYTWGNYGDNGNDGGCGGGGSTKDHGWTTGGIGLQGFNGGASSAQYTPIATNPGAGGGGIGEVGSDGNMIGNAGGDGGDGLSFNISGTPTYYGGGGSGSAWEAPGTNGIAGLGGGGTGSSNSVGGNGTPNTGGGGGCGDLTGGGIGGSGIVIISYPPRPVNPQNLLIHIAMDETSGTSLANTGLDNEPAIAYSNAQPVAARINYGRKIVGGTGRIDIDDDEFELPEYSQAFWIKFNSFPGQRSILFKPLTTQPFPNSYLTNWLAVNPNYLFWRTEWVSPPSQQDCISSTTLTTGTWYHIVLTYALGEKRIYINGALDTALTNAGVIAPQYNTSYKTNIGDVWSLNAVGADMTIDDYRMYDYPLTAGQVTTLYNSFPASILDAHGVILANISTTIDLGKMGVQIKANNNCTLKKVNLAMGCASTRAYLYDDAWTLIESAPITSLQATFNSALTSGNYYRVVTDGEGSQADVAYWDAGISFPYAGTNIDFTGGINGGSLRYDQIMNVVSVTTE